MERTVYDSFLSYHTRRILIVIWIIFGLGGFFVSLIAFGVMIFGGTNEIWGDNMRRVDCRGGLLGISFVATNGICCYHRRIMGDCRRAVL